MNMDDFEKKLQRQNLRELPRDWRDEILQTARAAAAQTASRDQEAWLVQAGRNIWQELIWPCRRAWTGIAAVWILIWGINIGLLSAPGSSPLTQTATAPEVKESIRERERVLAELIPHAPRQPAEPPRSQPRSERRIEFSAV